MTKKLLLGLGAPLSIIAPIVSVVACGTEAQKGLGFSNGASTREQNISFIKSNIVFAPNHSSRVDIMDYLDPTKLSSPTLQTFLTETDNKLWYHIDMNTLPNTDFDFYEWLDNNHQHQLEQLLIDNGITDNDTDHHIVLAFRFHSQLIAKDIFILDDFMDLGEVSKGTMNRAKLFADLEALGKTYA